MKECVVRVQTQHHLDVIIGRIRSLGGKYEHYEYIGVIGVNSTSMYTTYQAWVYRDMPVYIWLTNTHYDGLTAYLHNHDCACEVFQTVQDAVEYFGLNGV